VAGRLLAAHRWSCHEREPGKEAAEFRGRPRGSRRNRETGLVKAEMACQLILSQRVEKWKFKFRAVFG
jgi:hypothetical protein